MPVHVAAPASTASILSTMPSVSTAPSSSAPSSSPALQYAAMNGMFVKLHVKDGCGQAVDIPVKNLLRVNTTKEALSNEASYSILRHCALSQLFRFEPNQKIPTYAWKNFLTRFSYETNQHAHGQIVRYSINNNSELTEALEVAASIHLIELDEFETITDIPCSSSRDEIVKKNNINNNTIILEIHCEFINRRNVKNTPRQRRDPTIAAEHVVKTLHQWIQKASAFVVDIVGDLEHRDYVVVRSSNVDADGSGDAADGKKKFLIEEEDEEKEKRIQNQPIEWAKRFIEVLLVPERETKDSPVMVEHVHCSPPCKGFGKGEQQAQQPNLLDEYEESLEVLTASFVEGLKNTSKFIQRFVKDHQEKAKEKNRRSNSNNDEEDNLSLSASPTPSLVKSVASISSSSSIEEVVLEQGIEIVFDPNSQNKSVSSNGDKDEWKIFFGESKEEEEAVMISNPCEEEVISLASSEHKDSSSTASSFEQISEAKGKDADDDDVSWAMLSDDE